MQAACQRHCILAWTDGQFEKFVLICELCLKYSHSKCKQEPSLSLDQAVPLYP